MYKLSISQSFNIVNCYKHSQIVFRFFRFKYMGKIFKVIYNTCKGYSTFFTTKRVRDHFFINPLIPIYFDRRQKHIKLYFFKQSYSKLKDQIAAIRFFSGYCEKGVRINENPVLKKFYKF